MKTLIRVAALSLFTAAAAGAQVVYNNTGASTAGFSANAANWNTPGNCFGGYCGSYIGAVGGAAGYAGGGSGRTFGDADVLSLSLSGLGSHSAGVIFVTLFSIDSWDGTGYGCCAPDRFTVKANGNTIFDASFTDPGFASNIYQTYPDQFSTGNTYAPGTGAAEIGALGTWFWTGTPGNTAVYALALAFNDASSNLVFDFQGLTDNQGFGDESWALQNVKVQLNGREVVGTPEPASLTLFATGLAGLGVAVRRRKRNA